LIELDPQALLPYAGIIAALGEVGLQSVTLSPEGLDSTVADPSLSHGRRQLVAVARALLHPSKSFVMDEVTASLEEIAERQTPRTGHAAFSQGTIISVSLWHID
jgi:ABC-type transport system involved in cytochrome bd biosynthesis fused ATPase/permease subunit